MTIDLELPAWERPRRKALLCPECGTEMVQDPRGVLMHLESTDCSPEPWPDLLSVDTVMVLEACQLARRELAFGTAWRTRWWLNKGTQAKVARLFAHSQRSGVPAALVLSWDGKPRLWVMTHEDGAALCKQRLEEGETT